MALHDFTELASHHSDLSANAILLVTCSSTLSMQSCASALLLIALPVFLTIFLALILPDNSFVAPILYVSITESKLSAGTFPAFAVVVQSLSRVQLFVTPWTAAC